MEGKIPIEIIEKCKKYKQEHLLQFIGEYSEEQLEDYVKQLKMINFEQIDQLYRDLCVNKKGVKEGAKEIEPADPETTYSKTKLGEGLKSLKELGLKNLHKAAVLILAGGQGTRLGFDHAKGLYSIGLPSSRTIFEILAKRFLRVQALTAEKTKSTSSQLCHLYIMTNEINDSEIREFFSKHDNFGIFPKFLHFFTQGMLPSVDFNGKIFMETKSKIALSPNGNGGLFSSLLEKGSNIFSEMEANGVEYLQIIGIDNVLCKILDPIHVALSIDKKADCVIKTLPKTIWSERIGIFAKANGKYDMIEYSEISEDLAKKTNPEGELLFNHGNILNYLVRVKSLTEVFKKYAHDLTKLFHIAIKKIPHFSKGATVKPTENNGYKFELFINGFIKYLEPKSVSFFQVKREEEFSPVKNEPGNPVDSPDSARAMISTLHRQWLSASGAILKNEGIIEIDEQLSYEGENLESFKGKEINAPCYIKQ